MKRILFALTLVLLWQSAEANSQSIAEAARKERERRAAEGKTAPVITTTGSSSKSNANSAPAAGNASRSSVAVAAPAGDRTGGRKTDPEVGASITIQPGWQWSPSRNDPYNPTLAVHCPDEKIACQVQLSSWLIPLNQTQLTHDDRNFAQRIDGGRVLSRRDMTVAGYPAHDVIIDTGSGRVRGVAIVVPGVRRYWFRFKAVDITEFQPRDKYDAYASDFEQILQSFAPLGRPEKEGPNATPSGVLLNEESLAKAIVGAIASYERYCKEDNGKYFPLEEVVRGCGIPELVGTLKPDDIYNDPDYTYELTLTGDSFAVTATPKRSGIGAFLGDGKHIYFNPKGRATRSDRVIE
jgi:hypothetical protein